MKEEDKNRKNLHTHALLNPDKFSYAEELFMQGVQQQVIAERVGVSSITISKWKKRGAWADKRAARIISPQTMMVKLMERLNRMLDENPQDFDVNMFAKVAKNLRELQKDASIDDVINVLTDFGQWLEREATSDYTIDREYIQRITQLHDRYIENRLKDLRNGKA